MVARHTGAAPRATLDADSLDILRTIARQDWSAIDPSIFGTLFERFLDPDKRAQIGAHYTDPEKIMMIVEPVIVRPLNAEWETAKAELTNILSCNRNRDGTPGDAAKAKGEALLDPFLKRLADVRVLDPACGSGNFLYLALQALKDLEHRLIIEAVDMGLALRVIHLELNLARAGAAGPPPPVADDGRADEEPATSASPVLGRKTFEKISEVEGVKLTKEIKKNAGRIRSAETAGGSPAPRDYRQVQTCGRMIADV